LLDLRARLSLIATAAIGVVLLLPALAPVALAADLPVRVLTPAGITIDGDLSDWDTQDELAPLNEGGDTSKPVLAQSYARYDCATGTLYLMVLNNEGWLVVPSRDDTYVKSGETVLIDDLAADQRWIGYQMPALAQGIRSSISLPLHAEQKVIGALNLYASRPGVFGPQEQATVARFADEASRERLQRVMEEHLDRFAFREALSYDWRRGP